MSREVWGVWTVARARAVSDSSASGVPGIVEIGGEYGVVGGGCGGVSWSLDVKQAEVKKRVGRVRASLPLVTEGVTRDAFPKSSYYPLAS